MKPIAPRPHAIRDAPLSAFAHAVAAPVRRLADVLPWPQSASLRRAMITMWIVVGLTVGLLSVPLFLRPASAALERSDSIVVLAGGRGERAAKGLELARRGYADTVVVSLGSGGESSAFDCEGVGPVAGVKVICVRPDPDTTRGEARAIGGLAAEHGWDQLLLVTSTYHVTRAQRLVDRCTEAEVIAVAAEPNLPIPTWFNAVFHEWVGLGLATLEPSC